MNHLDDKGYEASALGVEGREKPGMWLGEGEIVDLSSMIHDLEGSALSPEGLDRLQNIDVKSLPRAENVKRLGPPIIGTRSFVCIVLNYKDHAVEAGMKPPSEPVVFLKTTGAICGPDYDLLLPPGSQKTDWEVELAVVIGSRARNVPEASALDHVAGYTLCNDVSERAWQLDRGGSWSKGKSLDSFGPIGPWLVTQDEIGNPNDLNLELLVDGELMQSSTTSNMIFSIPHLVSYVSGFMTLVPGDIIATGTPAGVGMGMRPARYFVEGQQIKLHGGPLGRQTHKVVRRPDMVCA